MIATGLIIAALAALAVLAAYDRRLAAMFVVSAAVDFPGAAARRGADHGARAPAAAAALDAAAACRRQYSSARRADAERRALARARSFVAGDPGRDRRQSASRNSPRRCRKRRRRSSSSTFPSADADRFDAFVRAQAPGATLERVPMLRGRIVAANGIKAEELKPGEGSAWVLRGDRGITYAPRCRPARASSPANGGPPTIPVRRSFRLKSGRRDDLKLKVGDTITVNVLGRNLTARIANLRAVDWQSLGINFVLVFSPGTFAGAPHTDIATLTFADGGSAAEETALVKALADAFPTVSAMRVKDALDTIDHLVGNLVLGLRGASSVTLDRRGAGAGRRAGGRPALSHLRRCRLEDIGSDAAAAGRGLRGRISADRSGGSRYSAWRPARWPPSSWSPA